MEWPPARVGEIHGKLQTHVDVMECGTGMGKVYIKVKVDGSQYQARSR